MEHTLGCPFCQSKEKRAFCGWTLSHQEWKKLRELHEKEHSYIQFGYAEKLAAQTAG